MDGNCNLGSCWGASSGLFTARGRLQPSAGIALLPEFARGRPGGAGVQWPSARLSSAAEGHAAARVDGSRREAELARAVTERQTQLALAPVGIIGDVRDTRVRGDRRLGEHGVRRVPKTRARFIQT